MNKEPLIIYFTLTKACNLACLHCVRSHTPNNHYNDEIQTMGTNDAIKVIKQLGDFYPNATLAITGGEPTLHPDFDTIAQESCICFKNIVLTTNGIFPEHKLKRLAELTQNPNFYIQVSLDGDEVSHDEIRGKGTYNKTIKSIIELCNLCRNNSISISTTVSKLNMKSMFNLAENLKHIPFHKWRLAPEQIFDSNQFARHISSSEWNNFVDEILKVCFFKVSIKKVFDFTLMEKSLEDTTKNRILRTNCGFGKYKMYIYPDFSVIPCTCMPHLVIVNILKDNIEDIDKRINSCQPVCSKDSVCNTCKFYPVCKGGCVGYSYYYQGKIGMGDIRCPKIKSNLK